MVMKAAPDGSFFKMRESWFETHNAFSQGICITFFHIFPTWADHQDGVYFFNSVNTRILFVLNLLLNSGFILE